MTTLWHDLLNLLGSSLSSLYNIVPNYGVAIILLTIAVRLILLPLTIKQTRSMQEMQKLQPELKRLQAKYKGGDKQKLNEEMMKLYKEHQVNPLGGCLPLLLQLPIFWALYRVLDGCGKTVAHSKTCAAGYVGVKYLPTGSALRAAIRAVTPGHLGHVGFLGMNLGVSPVAFVKSSGVLHAIPYIILVFLMVATTWYQQKQMTAVSSTQAANPQMQMMGKVMPVVLGVFSLELAAGVSIYWVASNIWTIVQQYFVLGRPALADGPAPGSGGTRPARSAKGGDAGASPGKPGKAKPALEKADAKTDGKADGRASPAKPGGKPGGKPADAAAKSGTGNGRGPGGQQGSGAPKQKRPVEAAKASASGTGKAAASDGKPAQDKAPTASGSKEVDKANAPAESGNAAAANGAGEPTTTPPSGGAGSSRPRPQRAPSSDRKRNRR